MSWKNIKEYYRIGHIVHVREGCVCIGSAWVTDLMRITPAGEVKVGTLGKNGFSNEDLARYVLEMTADQAKLLELLHAPDTFTADLPVYTFEGGDILEKKCEAYGWANVTHDGVLMYENTFSADRAQVIAWAKRNAECSIESACGRIEELKANLEKARVRLWAAQANLKKLEAQQ